MYLPHLGLRDQSQIFVKSVASYSEEIYFTPFYLLCPTRCSEIPIFFTRVKQIYKGYKKNSFTDHLLNTHPMNPLNIPTVNQLSSRPALPNVVIAGTEMVQPGNE